LVAAKASPVENEPNSRSEPVATEAAAAPPPELHPGAAPTCSGAKLNDIPPAQVCADEARAKPTAMKTEQRIVKRGVGNIT
jgi:hypothetical protein